MDDSRFVPFYSVGMVFWAVLFNKFWIRREAELGVQWGTIWSRASLRVRPEFTGTPFPLPPAAATSRPRSPCHLAHAALPF